MADGNARPPTYRGAGSLSPTADGGAYWAGSGYARDVSSSFAFACLFALVPLLVGEFRGWWWLRAPSKVFASVCFIAFGLASGGETSVAGRFGLIALALSFVGDVLLLWRHAVPFAAGLFAFLLAHVCYICAFSVLGPTPWVVVAALVPLSLLGAQVWAWTAPRLGRLAGPVVAYVIVITTMVGFAVGVAVGHADAPGLLLFAAAVAFWTSDVCVARERFAEPGPSNRLIGLPLYYAAQLGFAYALPLAAAS